MSSNNSWDYTYLGRRTDDAHEYQYILRTRSVQDIGATNPFRYSIQPKELTIIQRRLTPSPLKQASSSTQRAFREGEESWHEYLHSIQQQGQRQLLEEMNRKLDIQVSRAQHNAALFEDPQQQARYISGQNPVLELLKGEEDKIHGARFTEEVKTERYEPDGVTSLKVIEIKQDGKCANPRCAICYPHDQKQQKIVSASSREASSFASSSSYKPKFMQIEETLFGYRE